jgi:nicotinamidase-related amidase
MRTALLVIDVQNDYFPKGNMEVENSLTTSLKIKGLLRHFREKTLPVVHVQHIAIRPDATFLRPNTSGSAFHENVRPHNGEKIVIKNYPNSFRNTELHSYLQSKNIARLIIVGMMTHMCIDSTVRAAFDLGYECIVLSDCCATRSLKIHGNEVPAIDVQYSFLAALNGVFAKVLRDEEANELLDLN